MEKRLRTVKNGTVHSVYRRTVNLSAGGKIIALQAGGSPLSPVSLITALSPDTFGRLDVQTGNCVTFTPGAIEIDGLYRFSYADASCSDLMLSHALSAHNIRRLLPDIRTVLARAQAGGFDLIFNTQEEGRLPLIFLAAKKRLDACRLSYNMGNQQEAARELSHLIGLGIGLTPSGDDFLCGVLAGLTLCSEDGSVFAKTLRSEIAQHLSDTIDISAAFLSCALDSQYSQAITSLLHMPDPEALYSSFSAIGHSSGIDSLCGVCYALTLFTT